MYWRAVCAFGVNNSTDLNTKHGFTIKEGWASQRKKKREKKEKDILKKTQKVGKD